MKSKKARQSHGMTKPHADGRPENTSAPANSDPQASLLATQEPNAVAKEQTRAKDIADIEKFLCDAAGVKNKKLAQRLAGQAAAVQFWESFDGEAERQLGGAYLLQGCQPANATEAMLAVQMIGTHNAAMKFLEQANRKDQTHEGCDANVRRATGLMRLFTDQLQAMSKLKGKTGQQKVRVEHVHVHEGGQAIVGAVSTDKRGREDGKP